jgi:hypothetical protein
MVEEVGAGRVGQEGMVVVVAVAWERSMSLSATG